MTTGHGVRAVLLGLMLVLGGCSSDCHEACQMQRECVSAHLDVNACTQTCADRSDKSSAYAERTRLCAECMAGNACSELLNRCLLDCLGVAGRR